ncbi:MAG: hypothetical protein UT53_C0011G0013 [Candidatus Yanofskybacteria bacterium GW2011_GWD2_39_48]|uniref:Uncharacterized protein n=1 Tax=Candidatus Yanofskybacteria bacterium GW2011_GWD2_39_48 TaxID=1619031 RepID=A0A0G0P6S6_9BACT|nr:MAG: hypothetical protein UT53_C0011G0013 [Candidatus Yanofskybacteria bacterium GW2011_GWD2_39_48]
MNKKILVSVLVTAIVVGVGVWIFKESQITKVRSRSIVGFELLNNLSNAKTVVEKNKAIKDAQVQYDKIDSMSVFSFSNSSAKLASEESGGSGGVNIGGWGWVTFNCVFASGGEMLACD